MITYAIAEIIVSGLAAIAALTILAIEATTSAALMANVPDTLLVLAVAQ